MSKSKKYGYAIEAAIDQLGVQEATGNNDGIPAVRYMRGDELAWCAGFVLWCIENSGDPQLVTNSYLYYQLRKVSNFVVHMKTLGRWLDRQSGAKPARNDIIFFRGAGLRDVSSDGNHMGLVESVDLVGGFVHTIEGNTSNKVARRKWALDDTRVLGYARLRTPTAA